MERKNISCYTIIAVEYLLSQISLIVFTNYILWKLYKPFTKQLLYYNCIQPHYYQRWTLFLEIYNNLIIHQFVYLRFVHQNKLLRPKWNLQENLQTYSNTTNNLFLTKKLIYFPAFFRIQLENVLNYVYCSMTVRATHPKPSNSITYSTKAGFFFCYLITSSLERLIPSCVTKKVISDSLGNYCHNVRFVL